VHRERTFVTVALRIHVLVKSPLGDPTPDDFERADFDDAVAVADFEPRGLGIKHHLSHDVILTAATQPAAKREELIPERSDQNGVCSRARTLSARSVSLLFA
jgi:hypothetical protein